MLGRGVFFTVSGAWEQANNTGNLKMSRTQIYIGLDQEVFGGMTDTGRIIRDAWVFGLLPEGASCAGWNISGIDQLYDKVYLEWEKYGHLVSRLPPELRAKHERIYGEATRRAREMGWSGELEIENSDDGQD
jgi:hypothetical protein